MRWKVSPQADLRWRSWSDEVVVFHPPSGDTHILHPLAAEALRHLVHHAADVDELTSFIAQAFELEQSEPLRRQMEQCMEQFVELGLLERHWGESC